MTTEKNEGYRRNALKNAAIGGSTFGAGAYANNKVESYLKRSGKLGLWDATRKGKLGSTHVAYGAGKLGARSLQVTGLPIAALAVKQIVKPAPNRPVDINHDVVHRVVDNALLHDQVKRGRKIMDEKPNNAVAKYDEAKVDRKIVRRKQRARVISNTGGLLGISALAARSPEFASYAAKKFPEVKQSEHIKRLITHQGKTTKLSNDLAVGSIGVGSIGAFNNAKLQGLEAKQRKQELVNKGVIGEAATKVAGKIDDVVTARQKKRIESLIKPGTKLGREGQYEIHSLEPIKYDHPLDRALRLAGGRQFKFKMKGGGRAQGHGSVAVFPGGRVSVRGFHTHKGAAGLTAGLNERIAESAPRAATPGTHFVASGYASSSQKSAGYQTWRRLRYKDPKTGEERRVKYSHQGYGIKGLKAVLHPSIHTWQTKAGETLTPDEVKAIRRHVVGASTGKVNPHQDFNQMVVNNPNIKEFMSDMPWHGYIPGGQKPLQKTKLITGGTGLVGAGAVGNQKWDEHKHPRAYAGKFTNKGAVAKRDDKFIREYRNRISPSAEAGYKHLRSGVNSKRVDAAGDLLLGGGLAHYAVKDFKSRPGYAALGALGSALTIKSGINSIQSSREWNAKANAIKARAHQRARDGEWGKGRNVDMAKSMWVEKGISVGLPYPKGMLRKPALRAGHLMHTRTGKIVSVRGSVG